MIMFNKIVKLCEKHGFFRKISEELLKISSTGLLLQDNLQKEWFNDIVNNRDVQVFINRDENISESFDFAKEMCLGIAPFGIADFFDKKQIANNFLVERNNKIEFCNFFQTGLLLRCTIFVAPSSAVQFFHQWQRQRRMWWRKVKFRRRIYGNLSAFPGRYILTDIKTEENSQKVEIVAKYPWGEQLIETLTLHTDGHENITTNQLQIKDGRKAVTAHNIVSNTCLSTMLLNMICDAYEEPLFQDNPRPLLQFHRKLAPYKISFAITAQLKSVTDELYELAMYLCRQLRAINLTTLLIPGSYKNSLETQWKQYDELGIPYNVLLNENTLKNGVALLRSRDTTLKEQIHVSNLVDYLEKIFKNY